MNPTTPPNSEKVQFLVLPENIGAIRLGISADDFSDFLKTLNLWKRRIVKADLNSANDYQI